MLPHNFNHLDHTCILITQCLFVNEECVHNLYTVGVFPRFPSPGINKAGLFLSNARLLLLYSFSRSSATATSLTFVPVGPVKISPPTVFRALYASLFSSTSYTFKPTAFNSSRVSASA